MKTPLLESPTAPCGCPEPDACGTSRGAVLFVSANETERHAFEALAGIPASRLIRCDCAECAIELVEKTGASVFVFDADGASACWRDLLDRVLVLPEPPLFVLASRLADEALWADALNRGAWDVLAKPFDSTEVSRAVAVASERWQSEHRAPGYGRRRSAGSTGAASTSARSLRASAPLSPEPSAKR